MWQLLRNLWGANSPSTAAPDPSLALQPPPHAPAEYECGAPDYLGIGAQRCGTTWWHNLITSHPGVYDDAHLLGKVDPHYLRKERHFFDRFFNKPFASTDAVEYTHWLARPKGQIAGEWTPRYLIEHWTPALVKSVAPQTRLLVLLRDPVSRFISGMRHTTSYKRELDANDAHVQYGRGLYFRQLKYWLRVFPRSQFLLLQYEHCIAEPARNLERTFEFLGLPALPPSSFDFQERTNTTAETPSFVIDEEHRRSLINAYQDDVADLCREFPEIDVRLWKNFQ